MKEEKEKKEEEEEIRGKICMNKIILLPRACFWKERKESGCNWSMYVLCVTPLVK